MPRWSRPCRPSRSGAEPAAVPKRTCPTAVCRRRDLSGCRLGRTWAMMRDLSRGVLLKAVAPSNYELTLRGVVLGLLITLLFTAANVYFGLKAGLTFATSIPAAVISMGL